MKEFPPGYVDQFNKIFGEISYDNMAKAIAAFERSMITPNSPFDRFVEGDKNSAVCPGQARYGGVSISRLRCLS